MRVTRILILAMLMATVLLACGADRDVEVNVYVGDQATEAAIAGPTQPPTAVPTQAVESVEPTATSEQVPPSAEAPVEPTVEGPAEPAAEAPAEPTAAPPAEATAESPAEPTAAPPPTEPPPPPTKAPQTVEGDAYTLDPAAWEASLATLSSFRQKVVLDFGADGAGGQSRAVYEGEVTTNPSALHSTLRVEGQAASQLPSNQVEVIWIGEQAWIKVGRKPWVPVPVAALESEYAGQVVGVGDLLPFVQQALRVLPDETVNGIPCHRYAYDLDNLQTDAGMTSAQGDIWVAVDGGYVVRLTLNGQGTYYGTYTSSGTLNLVYDLYDVNTPITINAPH